MKQTGILITILCLMMCGSAQAQNVSEHNDQLFYTLGEHDYIVCANGGLNDPGYAALLSAYMAHTVENNLISRYLKIYNDQNMKSAGAMNEIVAQQKLMMTSEHLAILYTPYQDQLSLDDFFKIHVLNATNVMAVMTQKLGPATVRTLCRAHDNETKQD